MVLTVFLCPTAQLNAVKRVKLEHQASARALQAAGKDKPAAGNSWNFLQQLCKLVCVVRIQRTFRARFRSDLGVPWSLRKLMRPGYRPLSGPRFSAITPKGGHVVRDLSLDSVLSSISQIFLEKLRADAHDASNQAPRRAISEFVYDFYLNKTGVREVAERYLHDFFVSLRRYTPLHPRCRLFGNFLGIVHEDVDAVQAEQERVLSMPEAFEFYLKVRRRHACCGCVFVAVCGSVCVAVCGCGCVCVCGCRCGCVAEWLWRARLDAHGCPCRPQLLHRLQAKSARNRRGSTNFLFPAPSPSAATTGAADKEGAVVMWVESGVARQVVEKALSTLNNHAGTQALLEGLYAAETAGQLDLDVVLDKCMAEWAKNALSRQHLLENLFKVSMLHSGEYVCSPMPAPAAGLDPYRIARACVCPVRARVQLVEPGRIPGTHPPHRPRQATVGRGAPVPRGHCDARACHCRHRLPHPAPQPQPRVASVVQQDDAAHLTPWLSTRGRRWCGSRRWQRWRRR